MMPSSGSGAAPPQPKSILRGHKAAVHAAAFVRRNARLVTGDADGFVIVWDLVIMRARAVWQAHTNAILGIAGWDNDKLITHGRDNRLVVWKLSERDEASLSNILPLDQPTQDRPQPWLLHLLEVNAMNFCAFSSCPKGPSELFVAVPNALTTEAIDIFHLPSQSRLHTVRLGADAKGMPMALSLFRSLPRPNSNPSTPAPLVLAAGYENGLVVVAQCAGAEPSAGWRVTYRSPRAHGEQPVLSLDVAPARDCFFTSGADARVVKHPVPQLDGASFSPPPASNPTGGDGLVSKGVPAGSASLLSVQLASAGVGIPTPERKEKKTEIQTQPLKILDTRHAGQQGLRVRSDGRILATAGWDARVRVYSAALKELAVLVWHRAGCYAIAFSDVEEEKGAEILSQQRSEKGTRAEGRGQGEAGTSTSTSSGKDVSAIVSAVVPKLVEMTVRDRRAEQVRATHWLASGSKDGKVSLWDVF